MSGGPRRDERFVERDAAFVRRSLADGSLQDLFAGHAKHDSYMHYRYGYHPGAHHKVIAPPEPVRDRGMEEELMRQNADLKGLWQLEKEKVQARDATIESLKKQLAEKPREVFTSGSGLPAEFDFSRRVYQCQIDAPGVGYRNTPKFSDKNKDGSGPQSPQVIIADAICQGLLTAWSEPESETGCCRSFSDLCPGGISARWFIREGMAATYGPHGDKPGAIAIAA